MISTIAILSAIWRFFCACFWWVLSNKRWSLIIALLVCCLFLMWQVNSLTGDLNKADAQCMAKVNQVKDELKQYKADQKEAIETAKTTVAIQQQKWAEQLLQVEQNASKKIQDAVVAAHNVDLANRGLSEQISIANQRLSAASSEAVADYAKTCNLVSETWRLEVEKSQKLLMATKLIQSD